MIAKCGDYHVAPAKSRVAFLAKVRFAGVNRLSDRGMTCSLSLPEPPQSAKIYKVSEMVPGWFVHELGVDQGDQLDEEVQGWLCQSYRLMEMRERLGRGGA